MGKENERRRGVVVLSGRSGLLSLENVDAEWADAQHANRIPEQIRRTKREKRGVKEKGK